MRILCVFLNTELRTGGHIRCLELMEGLAKKGHSVSVVLNAALNYEARDFSAVRLNASYRRGRLPPASIVFKRSIAALIKAGGINKTPNVVIVFGETHLGAAMVCAKAFDAAVVFGYQSNSVREAMISFRENILLPFRAARAILFLLLARLNEMRVARLCDVIVFQSAYDRDDFLSRNRTATTRSFVIGGNIGLPRFIAANRSLNKSVSLRRILFMGTLGERKGLHYLLQALHILRSEGRAQLELHVAGTGSQKESRSHERYCARHGLSQSVTFYGRVPDIFPLMRDCDIMVVPSLFDSYPDIILLALHAGIPVVGSHVGGIPEILLHQDLLFPSRDASSIASLIRRCLDEPSRYLELRALSASRFEPFQFDWPAAWESVVMGRLAN